MQAVVVPTIVAHVPRFMSRIVAIRDKHPVNLPIGLITGLKNCSGDSSASVDRFFRMIALNGNTLKAVHRLENT